MYPCIYWVKEKCRAQTEYVFDKLDIWEGQDIESGVVWTRISKLQAMHYFLRLLILPCIPLHQL